MGKSQVFAGFLFILPLIGFTPQFQLTQAQETGANCQPITVDNIGLLVPLREIQYRNAVDVEWSPDGQFFVVKGFGNINLFNGQSFEDLGAITTDDSFALSDPFFDGSGRFLAWYSFDGLNIWDRDTQLKQQITVDEGRQPAVSLAFSPDGTELYELTDLGYPYGEPNEIHVWDIESSEQIREIDNNTDRGIALFLNNTGTQIITAGDASIISRDSETWEETFRLERRFPDQISRAELSPDGSVITILWFTGNTPFDFYITSYSTEDLTELGEFGPFERGTSIQYSPDGNLFAYSEDNDIYLRVLDETQILDASSPIVMGLSGHRSEPQGIEFSADMRYLVSASTFIGVERPADADEGTVIIWGVCS